MTFVISDFIFPASIFSIVYFFINRMTKNSLISVLGGVGTLFGSYLLSPRALLELNTLLNFNVISSPYYMERLPFIEFVFIPFILAIFFTYLTIETRKVRFAVLSGLVGGLLFYSYIYYAIVFSIGLVILFLTFTVKKSIYNLKLVFLIMLITGIVSLVYLINFVKIQLSPEYSEILTRYGVSFGRINLTYITRTFIYGTLLLLVALIIKNKGNAFFILSAFFLAGLVGLNTNLFLGYSVQLSHYISTVLQPLGVILLVILFNELCKRKRAISSFKFQFLNKILETFSVFLNRNFRLISILLISMLLLQGLLINVGFSMNKYQDLSLTQSQREIFNWLEKNTNTDDVVLTLDIENNFLLPVYTHNNPFLPNGAQTSIHTNKILERVYIAYKLFDVQYDYLEKLLESGNLSLQISNVREDLLGNSFNEIFWTTYFFHLKFPNFEIPSEFKNNLLTDYTSYNNETNELLSKYRIDYIIVGPYEKSISRRDLSQLRLVYVWSNNDTEIYKVNH